MAAGLTRSLHMRYQLLVWHLVTISPWITRVTVLPSHETHPSVYIIKQSPIPKE